MKLRVLFAALLLVGACSGADEGVRTIDDGGSSGSGSASDTGGSGSSSSTSASGTADVACAPPSEPTDSAVTVALTEWEVRVPERMPAGQLTITAGNIGGDDHELVIVRGDDAEALPVADGKVQEDQLPEGDFIGEIESFAPGGTCAGEFDLPAGDYVFFCNLVEEEADGTIESHFEEGMHTVVTVG